MGQRRSPRQVRGADPSGRVCEPEYIVAVIALLASDDANFMTAPTCQGTAAYPPRTGSRPSNNSGRDGGTSPVARVGTMHGAITCIAPWREFK